MSSEHAGGTPGPGAVSDRMRALLSRAAEEQLLEQRQVSTVLGELRTLLEDVDERLATGEQVERVAAEVRAVSARLDAVQARSDELADRITDATAVVGQAAQDLVDAVAARVTDQVEAQLRQLAAAASVDAVAEQVERSERRLAAHVDDAVLALAEVVLRRRRPVVPAAPTSVGAADDRPAEPAEDVQPPVADPDVEDAPADAAEAARVLEDEPADTETEPTAPEDAAPGDAAPDDAAPPADLPPDAPPDGHDDVLDAQVAVDLVAAEQPAPELVEPFPGDGYVLVPADVPVADAEPAPVVQQERRTTERRTAERTDGSGRRQRPWWRRV